MHILIVSGMQDSKFIYFTFENDTTFHLYPDICRYPQTLTDTCGYLRIPADTRGYLPDYPF